jgi:signal peptidase I
MKTPSRLQRFWKESLKPILFILLIMGAFRSSFADWNDVPTGSMKPTILEGDRVVINKLAYDLKVPFTTVRLAQWSHPERGDIVVFFSPADGIRLVKRVVGLPGDTVAMRENRVFVNGVALNYEALPPEMSAGLTESEKEEHTFAAEDLDGRSHAIMVSSRLRSIESFAPFTVAEGQYFMMGDNRDNSRDSRFFGAVPRKSIIGRAEAVAFSLDRTRSYQPRWSRSGTRLR